MDTQTIPQFVLSFNPAAPTTDLHCHFCNQIAQENTIPPLCSIHFDWVMLINFMQRRDLPVTPDSLKARLTEAQANGGVWTMTAADVDRLFAQFFSGSTFAAEFAADKAAFAQQVREGIK